MKQLSLVHKLTDHFPTKPRYHWLQWFQPRSPKQITYMLLAIATLILLAWAFRPVPIRVEVGRVSVGALQVTVNAEGKTRVRDRFVITALANGHLDRITLNEGDLVQPGMVLAHLDPLPLNSSVQEALGRLAEWRAQRAGVATLRPKPESLEQSRTRIQKAEADQMQAEAKVAQAQASLQQSRRDRDRALQLETSGAISRKDREAAELTETTRLKELEAAQLAARAAASDVDVAKAAVAVLQKEQTDPDYLIRVYDARIASTEAELSSLQQEANRTEIKAPVKGRVLRILQKSAQFVSDGTPLLEIGDTSSLELVIDVLSSDAVTIKPGNPIAVESSSTAQPLRAVVRRIEPAAFTKVSALGVEEQRVNVIGAFVEPSRSLGDAYRVEVKIVTWEAKNVLKVPLSALFRCEQSWCVFVAKDGKAHRQSIAIAHRNDGEAEVQHGLRSGDLVILHPTENIDEGKAIAW